MKRAIMMVFMVIITLNISIFSQNIGLASYWTKPTMNLREASQLAKFDLIIVDAENMFNNLNSLDSLKKWNKEIKLLAYYNPQETWKKFMANRPLQMAWRDSLLNYYPNWFLRDYKGEKIVFYSQMEMLNLSNICPRYKVNGQMINYEEWITKLIINKILLNPIWDGYFMDNGGGNVSWVNNLIDANQDSKIDKDYILDHAWSEGVYKHLASIRQEMGPNFIIVANKGTNEFMGILNGRMFENFPNNYLGDRKDFGWWQCMANAHQTGEFTIFQIKTPNLLPLAISSALLLDHNSYIAVGQNNIKVYLEIKRAHKFKKGKDIIISRKFEKGLIKIIPSQKRGETIIPNK